MILLVLHLHTNTNFLLTLKAAFHDADTDILVTIFADTSDTRDFLARLSVSMSWNAALTVSTCTSISFHSVGPYNRHMNKLPAKLNDFYSLGRFTRFIGSTDLSQFLSLVY